MQVPTGPRCVGDPGDFDLDDDSGADGAAADGAGLGGCAGL